jgi:hypothetical protein
MRAWVCVLLASLATGCSQTQHYSLPWLAPPDGTVKTYGKAEAEAALKGVKDAKGNLDVDADQAIPVYVGDGQGNIWFDHWQIRFRTYPNLCLFLSSVNAKAFSTDGVLKTCGESPDIHVYARLHIEASDIVK